MLILVLVMLTVQCAAAQAAEFTTWNKGTILTDPITYFGSNRYRVSRIWDDAGADFSWNWIAYAFYSNGKNTQMKDGQEYAQRLVETGFFELIEETSRQGRWEMRYIGKEKSFKPAKSGSTQFKWHVLVLANADDEFRVLLVDGFRFDALDAETPAAKPTTKPTTKPVPKPTTKPTAKPTDKPATLVSCSKCGGDGRVQKNCSTCSGSGDMRCGSCSGDGKRDCISCSGKGYDRCSSCGGDGENRCSSCSGSGKRNGKRCSSCSGTGDKRCTSCSGKGKKTCSACRGSGDRKCTNCGGDGKKDCPICSGSGKKTSVCSTCSGSGKVKK